MILPNAINKNRLEVEFNLFWDLTNRKVFNPFYDVDAYIS